MPSPNSVITRSSSVGARRPCACAVRASGTISRSRSAMRPQILDARHDAEHLAAAESFALDRLADHHAVERHDEGAHREPIDRRRGDQRSSRARRSAPVAACAGSASRSASAHARRPSAASAVPCGRRRNAAPRRPPAGRDRRTRPTLASSAWVPTTMLIEPSARPRADLRCLLRRHHARELRRP